MPEKYVVAYTGGSEIRLIQESITLADRYVQKDAQIEDWCEILDVAICEITNPILTWKKLRYKLLDSGIPPLDLAVLEDTYVRTYNSGYDKSKQSLEDRVGELQLPSDIRSIVLNLVASAIFKFAFIE